MSQPPLEVIPVGRVLDAIATALTPANPDSNGHSTSGALG